MFTGIGECMIELSPKGDNLWSQAYAGDVLNTLWYARAVLPPERTVAFHSAFGNDAMSRDMIAFFHENRIDTVGSPIIEDRIPGLYAIRLERGERSFTYWRDTSAARKLASDSAALSKRIEASTLVYFSGITLGILTPKDRETLFAAIADRPDGCIAAFDPNIRPRLWKSIADMSAATEQAAKLCDIALPGVDDEAVCFGKGTVEDVAERYAGWGVGHIVVKDGGNGVFIVHDGKSESVPAEKIEDPVDTTAAGDSFAGTYLARIIQGAEPASAAATAHKVAAEVVQHPGALCPHIALPV